jgi:hypothetical protein
MVQIAIARIAPCEAFRICFPIVDAVLRKTDFNLVLFCDRRGIWSGGARLKQFSIASSLYMVEPRK